MIAGTQPSFRVTADVNLPIDDASAFRVAAMGQYVDSTRDVMQNHDYGVAPSLSLRDGHADRDHPRGLADAQQRHARLRIAAGQRRARGGQSQELLRRHRRPDAAGRRQPQRNDHPQGRGERHAAQPDVLLALQDRRAGVRSEQCRHAVADGRLHGVPGGEPEQHHRLAALVAVRRDRQSRPRDHRFIALQPDGRHHRIPDRRVPASADRRPGARPRHERHAELHAQHPGQSEQLLSARCRSSTRCTRRRPASPP